MFLVICLAVAVAAAVLAWRLRVAATALHHIPAEPPDPDAARAEVDEPDRAPAIVWPHPPNRLWVR